MRDIDQQSRRNAILNLLSDIETARVSNAEDHEKISAGDDYIDLSDLAKGVQTADTGMISHQGEILPKSAVSAATWIKICDEL